MNVMDTSKLMDTQPFVSCVACQKKVWCVTSVIQLENFKKLQPWLTAYVPVLQLTRNSSKTHAFSLTDITSILKTFLTQALHSFDQSYH